jgi:NAD(P)-dependent dehydrogenase (short-subunit alcohol dehydrogenase family)
MQAFVTGGGGGLGSAIAEQLLARGVGVALVDRAEQDAVAAAERLSVSAADGALAVPVGCDISSSADVSKAWRDAEAALGPIDVAVNCAGIWDPVPFVEMTDETWNRTILVNLTGAFHVSRTAAAAWVPAGRKGAIVNVASTAALVSAPIGSVAYGASKAGLVGLTTHLAVELGPHGIRVNAIAPHSFRSPMNAERLAQPGQEERTNKEVPLGRVAEASEIASAVAYLALDASYVNGVVVPVDGGTVVRM